MKNIDENEKDEEKDKDENENEEDCDVTDVQQWQLSHRAVLVDRRYAVSDDDRHILHARAVATRRGTEYSLLRHAKSSRSVRPIVQVLHPDYGGIDVASVRVPARVHARDSQHYSCNDDLNWSIFK